MYGFKEIMIAVGVFVGIAILALAASGAMLLWDKHRLTKAFDERQMFHRGRGTTLGFYVMVGFNFIVAIWDMFDPISWTVFQTALTGCLMGSLVSVTYFMLTDSWVKLRQKAGWAGYAFILIGILQIVTFTKLNDSLRILVMMGEESAGKTEHFFNLMVGVFFIYMGLLQIICRWWHDQE